MSRENLHLARHVLEDWKLGEVDEAEIRSVYHPDVELLPLRAATEGAYRGYAGIARFVADTEEVFEEFDFRCEILEVGERALAWGTVHVRARQSGIETDIPVGGLFEFRDGKIVRWEDFGSREKALEAAALAQPGPEDGENRL
jgi:ketosteroid isomerase-like protein